MKTFIAFGFTAAVSLAATVAPTGSALAATVASGNICHNYNKGQANDLDFYSDGIKNGATSSRSVICPLVVEHTSASTGYVYVQYDTTVAFSCTLYSYSWNDSFLGSKSGTTGTGKSILYLGTVPANSFSNHAVLCTLPANYQGQIVGIESYF